MILHLQALSSLILIYLLLAASCWGWGLAVASLLHLKLRGLSPLLAIWLGWVTLLVLLQVANFFFPLTAWVVLPIFLAGCILLFSLDAGKLQRINTKLSWYWIFYSLSLLLAAAWLGSRAMLSAANYDTGLYHLNIMGWINTYPVVPGLGNLHERLAFNQSFFTYAAALNFAPYFQHGRSVANSFLFLLTLAWLLSKLRPLIEKPALLLQEHPFQYLPYVFLLPVLAFFAIKSDGITSPTPDLASTLVQMILFTQLASGMASWKRGERSLDAEVLTLAALAATAVTLKLSNLAFAAVIFGFCLLYAWRSSTRARTLLRLLIPNTFIILIWAIRGYILSGVPFFPSTLGYIRFDWSIPLSSIQESAQVILGWARQPGENWRASLTSWGWVNLWFQHLLERQAETRPLLICAGILSGLLAAVLLYLFIRRKQRLDALEWSILLPGLAGLLYWFFTAPDYRFANLTFWLLVLAPALLLLSLLYSSGSKHSFIAACVVAFLLVNFAAGQYLLANLNQFRAISKSGWREDKTVELVSQEVVPGLTLYAPAHGNQCWTAPLTCAPTINQDLRLRVPGDLGAGFRIQQ